MKKKIIALMFVTCLLCGCSKTVSKLDDGKEAVASFDKKKLSISVDDLYKSLKDKYGTTELIDLIDSAILKDKYTIKELTPFDMFPQTKHCETIAILERK